MNEIEKLKEHENLFLTDDNFWWIKEEGLPSYEYVKNSHKDDYNNIIKFVKETNTVVQAGGHCGYVPNFLSNYFKNVYTFEPNHSMFLALCLNNHQNNVLKFQACLGNEHKLVDLITNKCCVTPGANYVKGEGSIPMFMVDDLNLINCDLLMFDTEGFEYNILLGAKNTIQKYKPIICLERYWGPAHFNISEQQMDSLLSSLGYSLVSRAGESDFIYKYGEIK